MGKSKWVNWIDKDPKLEYMLKNSSPLHPAQKELIDLTLNTHPRYGMLGTIDQLQLLQMMCKMINAKQTLDIGVFTGLSALTIALALPDDGKVVACDINDEYAQFGIPIWKKAMVDHKIDLKIAPAVNTLESLVRDGQEKTFDYAFIDADKVSYPQYYEYCLKLIRPGGLIAIDNVWWRGGVIDSTFDDPATNTLRSLAESIAKDERVERLMLALGDGLYLCRIK